ncbi:hypothetical protein JRQ81_011695 [Phrynocephalus forsythii]|uniref:Uncharacterized protein n=1 Tax=Phrynocephalus forsythii TaxID=171643 RepID=A0A9Q0X9L5_9SAUR|nr:hypothetical protein JRQ81_011695 [Phrynocephalus forsythii]
MPLPTALTGIQRSGSTCSRSLAGASAPVPAMPSGPLNPESLAQKQRKRHRHSHDPQAAPQKQARRGAPLTGLHHQSNPAMPPSVPGSFPSRVPLFSASTPPDLTFLQHSSGQAVSNPMVLRFDGHQWFISQMVPFQPGNLSASSSESDRDNDGRSQVTSAPQSDVGKPRPSSMAEKIKNYSDFIIRMAKSLNVPTHRPALQHSDHLFDKISPDFTAPVHLSVIPSFLSMAKETLQELSSPSTSSRFESFYRVHDEGAPFLLKRPHPNSVIVAVSQMQSSNKRVHIPPSKEGRKLDSMGRRLYSTASLAFKVANYQGVMGAYQRVLLDKLLPFLDLLPDSSKAEATAIYKEAMFVAAQQMLSARHASNCATRSLGAAVILRRHSWLRSTGLPEDIKGHIEYLPFEGEGLFHIKTDEIIQDLEKKRTIAKRLNLYPQHQK